MVERRKRYRPLSQCLVRPRRLVGGGGGGGNWW